MLRLNAKLVLVLGGLAAFYFGTMIPLLVQVVSSSGRNLVNIQGADEYLVALMWALALAVVISILPLRWPMKRTLLALWGIRCVVTLGAMLFYESYYSLDAYEYYKNILRQTYSSSNNWGDGTNFVISLGVFLDSCFPFGRSYHAFKVVWSFFGLLALIPLYNIYCDLWDTKRENLNVLWALGLFPSLLFWTSILGKDPLAGLGIACTAYGLLRLQKKIDLAGLLYVGFGVFLLSSIRFWLIPIFLAPAILSFAWGKSKRKIWRYGGLALCVAVFIYVFYNMQAVLMITSSSEAFESLNYVSSAWSRGGSGLEAPSFGGITDVIKFLPLGLFTAIFRPLPGEVNNIFGIISGFESLFILGIFISSWRNMKSKYLTNPVIIYCWAAIFIWGSFYAFISYQNLGTAVRFRAQILPFIVLLPYLIKAAGERSKK